MERELLDKRYPIYIGGKEVYANREFEKRSPIDTSISIGRFQRGTRDHAVKTLKIMCAAHSISKKESIILAFPPHYFL
ncbi:hypothetical protein [Pyrobaculum sp.]|uniref:hypothetical protein n=1 Tax=Pyrobaculum sp. TaxID=2004705 RepID=UPI0031668C9F